MPQPSPLRSANFKPDRSAASTSAHSVKLTITVVLGAVLVVKQSSATSFQTLQQKHAAVVALTISSHRVLRTTTHGF